MFKDIKWNRVAIISVISLIVLFGGYFLYQDFSLTNSIDNTLSSIEGVQVNDIEIDHKNINLSLTLNDINNFQATYNQIEDAVNPYLRNRDFTVKFNNTGSKAINEGWHQSYFYIAEAVEQKNYSLIPETINKLKVDYSLERVDYSMDETNIYIDLHDNQTSFYVVIERNGSNLEVNKNG